MTRTEPTPFGCAWARTVCEAHERDALIMLARSQARVRFGWSPASTEYEAEWFPRLHHTASLRAGAVVVDYWAKPIPTPAHDYQAWFHGQEDSGYCGSGATAKEAINNLLED